MGAFIDLTGKKFERLTVIRRVENKNNKIMWLCNCVCGKTKIINSHDLRSEHTRSCGCIHSESIRMLKTTHGLTNTRLNSIWCSMLTRCSNINSKSYDNYGGRGITICNEWKTDFLVFYNWAMENNYSQDLTLDRIDNNGNYEPENCRWATTEQQMNNTRHNVFLELDGKKMTVAQWSKYLGINVYTLWSRIKSGWNVQDIINCPVLNNTTRHTITINK
ncbi:MAG: hypothetical protein WCO84_01055 [bacterium]